MKYRSYSFSQKLLMIVAWVLAIAAVILIGQSVAPIEQNNSIFQLKMFSPLVAALVITIFVSIAPRGRVIDSATGAPVAADSLEVDISKERSVGWQLKMVALVLCGMIWVCTVAPLMMAVLFSYEVAVLEPACGQLSRGTPDFAAVGAVTGAKFRPNLRAMWGDEYRPILCEFNGGSQVVGLDHLVGNFWELLINVASGFLVVVITLGLWYFATYKLFWPLIRRKQQG